MVSHFSWILEVQISVQQYLIVILMIISFMTSDMKCVFMCTMVRKFYPPKFVCWNTDPKDDDIRRWGLWEVLSGICTFIEAVPLHRTRTQQESAEYEPGSGPLGKYHHAGPLILDFPASRTKDIYK